MSWCFLPPVALRPVVHGRKRRRMLLAQDATPTKDSKTNNPGHNRRGKHSNRPATTRSAVEHLVLEQRSPRQRGVAGESVNADDQREDDKGRSRIPNRRIER